jgi:alkylation response protein AidB-like acyl-CoA dehydrogenase
MSYLKNLDSILKEIIEPLAQKTDQDSVFPRAAVTALGQAGLLGLMSSTDVGGLGLGLKEAANVVEKIAKVCPSTAMVVTMHYCGSVVIEKCGKESLRKDVAAGMHLITLAWSDLGSRSHFWAPIGKAQSDGEFCLVDGHKSMVTSAGEADSYIWSTTPMAASGASTLWFVDKNEKGLSEPKPFDGVGLKGNASSPISAKNLRLPKTAMLGADGGGFDIIDTHCFLLSRNHGCFK